MTRTDHTGIYAAVIGVLAALVVIGAMASPACGAEAPFTPYTTAYSLQPSEMSADGIKMLKRFEALTLTRKPDLPTSNYVIGYGHTMASDDNRLTITEAEAEGLLVADLKVVVDALHALVTVNLNKTQFDALSSFVYNIGTGAFAKSKVLAVLNAGDWWKVPQEMLRWTYAEKQIQHGLIKRRLVEGLMFVHVAPRRI